LSHSSLRTAAERDFFEHWSPLYHGPNPSTWTHWTHPDWFGQMTTVHGTGKYRFNHFGSDGFTYWQYRFKSKDEAIEFLSMQGNRLYWVKPDHPQYEVRQEYMGDDWYTFIASR
jgi:hypothetical protein